jgi:hypothetical protein
MTIVTCSVEGCPKPRSAKTLCSTHYARLQRGKPLDHPLGWRTRVEGCSVEGCDRPHEAKGLCATHYRRVGRTGTTRGDIPIKTPDGTQGCLVDGCGNPHKGLGYCASHHQRLANGLPLDGPFLVNGVGDEVGYAAVHQRNLRSKGSAGQFSCVDCGGRAAEWSYNHSGVKERIEYRSDGVSVPYSTDPDQYEPRCVPCHRRFDHG